MCSVLKYVPPLDNWSPFNVLCAVAANDSSPPPAASAANSSSPAAPVSMDDSAMNDTMSFQSSSSSVSSLDSGCDSSSSRSSSQETSPSSLSSQESLTSHHHHNNSSSSSSRMLMRMVSEAGCGSRQDEEALAASALLDLATADDNKTTSPHVTINNKTSVITSNPTLSSSSCARNRYPHPHRPDQKQEQENRVAGDEDGLVHLMVKSNSHGQSVIQLPNGMEFLFDPRSGTKAPSSISLPSSLVNGTLLSSAASSSESGRQYAVIDLSKKKSHQETGDTNNNFISSRMDQENPCPDRQHRLPDDAPVGVGHQPPNQMSLSFSNEQRNECRSGVPARVLPPNVMHFIPNTTSSHMSSSSNGVYYDNIRRSFSSSSSSCSSVDGSESCCSSSGGGGGSAGGNNPAGILISSNMMSCASGIGKKRGRKRLYDECTDQMLLHSHPHHHPHHLLHHHHNVPSNPIKEFRQRQRVRERQEDERLQQLETRYKNNVHCLPVPVALDELYDSRGLNMKFPRVKTAMKRGKAADDSERTNRKKECARRDSKNYRERAKAKRDLIVKKIAFLEDLLKSVTIVPKFQYVFS